MEKQIIKLHEGLVSDTMPEKILDLNDGKGGFIYNYGIEEVTEEVTVEPASEDEGRAGGSSDSEAENPEPHTATVTKYRHNALVMAAPKTQNNILETLLAEKYPGHVEQKLFNDYNAAKEKVLPSSAKEGYLQFLADRKAIKEMVEADCAEYGVPNTL